MSEECEDRSSPIMETETLTAEFKDGQLQIVEVTPFSNAEEDDDDDDDDYVETVHMEAEPGGCNYVEVFDVHGEQVVQLDLMNLTLVKCKSDNDSQATYKLVTEQMPDDDKEYEENNTFFLGQDTDNAENRDPTTSKYMVLMDDPGETSSLGKLRPPYTKPYVKKNKQKKTVDQRPKTVAELLEKKKALDKAKKLLSHTMRRSNRGRPASLPMPGPDEMLSSPDFRLYLYHCRLCSFKCNAAKELTQHKKTEHLGTKYPTPDSSGRPKETSNDLKKTSMYECLKCKYKGHSPVQLMRHVQEHHLRYAGGADSEPLVEIDLDMLKVMDSETLTLDQETLGQETLNQETLNQETLDQETLNQETLDEETLEDIIECGACGFQTTCTATFTEHAAVVHNAHVTLPAEFT